VWSAKTVPAWFLAQSHRQFLLFDAKYPLTNKNCLFILHFTESKFLSKQKKEADHGSAYLFSVEKGRHDAG